MNRGIFIVSCENFCKKKEISRVWMKMKCSVSLVYLVSVLLLQQPL